MTRAAQQRMEICIDEWHILNLSHCWVILLCLELTCWVLNFVRDNSKWGYVDAWWRVYRWDGQIGSLADIEPPSLNYTGSVGGMWSSLAPSPRKWLSSTSAVKVTLSTSHETDAANFVVLSFGVELPDYQIFCFVSPAQARKWWSPLLNVGSMVAWTSPLPSWLGTYFTVGCLLARLSCVGPPPPYRAGLVRECKKSG
jgi:hypothetical protein